MRVWNRVRFKLAELATIGRTWLRCGAPDARRSSIRNEMRKRIDEHQYHYTSGRWLYNEGLRLQERVLEFSLSALETVAAEAVSQTPNDVTTITKLGEGGFNRVFLFTMNDGTEVIARLPYHITTPRRLTVASEVATLRLLQLHGIPVPKVLSYCAESENPVGAEYIIMEKAQGQELGDRWLALTDHERLKLIANLSKLEQRLFSMSLPAYGSIFYPSDLDESAPRVNIPQTEFCVGPSVDQSWWHENRRELSIHRGPFANAEEFLVSGALKELTWLQAYGKPTLPSRQYRQHTSYLPSQPAEHMESLHQYLSIATYLVPQGTDTEYLLKPTLRHPDLNPRNIFVNENLQITSLIDWQHCSADPLFLQAGVPDAFANYGDEESLRLRKPELPANLLSLPAEQQREVVDLYRRRYAHFYYIGGALKFNKDHYKAMRLASTPLKQLLCFTASAPWQGDNISLRAALMNATVKWELLTASPDQQLVNCPISFTPMETDECLRIRAAIYKVDRQLDMLRDRMGISSDGWVPNEMYEHAVAENQRIKDELLQDVSEEERARVLRDWPFDDHPDDW